MFNRQPALFTDPNIEYPIYNMNLHFDDYIAKCKTIITNTRRDLTTTNAEIVIEANSPFELKPKADSKVGVLMVHGLLDSPFQFKDIGNQLHSQGFLVRSLLLPGHGTIPGALLNIDYHQWIQAIQYGITSLAKDVEKILLVGNSTGASLLLHQAAQHNANIIGAILLSPPIKIRSIFTPASSWHRAISPTWKRAAWFYVDPEETLDYAKYGSLPYNAIYQVHQLSKELKAKTPTCPLFFIMTQDDAIVCPKAITDYFIQRTKPSDSLLLYTNQTNDFSDTRIEVRSSAYPDQDIINFSHIALPFSPDNTHYGIHGDYPDISYVSKKGKTISGEFLRNNLYYNNWMLKLHMTRIRQVRLAFNPDFAHMCQRIEEFGGLCAEQFTG